MKLTNKLALPQAIVDAVSNDPYDPGRCNITVTRLIQPARKVALEALHAHEITEDVSDRLFALLGQAVHVILERAAKKAVVEGRLSIERQGWVISGGFDHLVLEDGALTDYKITGVYSVRNGGKVEWEQQLNLLALILREHGIEVRKLEIVAILRDWSAAIADRQEDYPAQQAVKIEIPIWDDERCEEFIDERIRAHQMAREKLPECSPSERWSKPDSWALMKEGRKTAVRVFDNEADAASALQAAGPGHTVERRPGKNVRCEGYCPCAEFCQQWKALKKE